MATLNLIKILNYPFYFDKLLFLCERFFNITMINFKLTLTNTYCLLLLFILIPLLSYVSFKFSLWLARFTCSPAAILPFKGLILHKICEHYWTVQCPTLFQIVHSKSYLTLNTVFLIVSILLVNTDVNDLFIV